MNEHLIAARWAMIAWLTLCLIPYEIALDLVDGELERRGATP